MLSFLLEVTAFNCSNSKPSQLVPPHSVAVTNHPGHGPCQQNSNRHSPCGLDVVVPHFNCKSLMLEKDIISVRDKLSQLEPYFTVFLNFMIISVLSVGVSHIYTASARSLSDLSRSHTPWPVPRRLTCAHTRPCPWWHAPARWGNSRSRDSTRGLRSRFPARTDAPASSRQTSWAWAKARHRGHPMCHPHSQTACPAPPASSIPLCLLFQSSLIISRKWMSIWLCAYMPCVRVCVCTFGCVCTCVNTLRNYRSINKTEHNKPKF